MRPIRLACAVLALTALLCSSAVAKNYAPPGKAGTSQYAEDIPTGGGNVKTPLMGGGNRSAAQISHIGAGKKGLAKLVKLGKVGAQAAQLAESTAPSTGSSGRHHTGGVRALKSQNPASTPLSTTGGSAVTGLAHLFGGSDVVGIGAFLPLLLALSLIAAVLAAALRLRSRSSGDITQP